jgi:hypothetical protein
VSLPTKSVPGPRHRALRDIVIYGACGGLAITLLRLMEYRFLVIEHSVEIYGALIAALFAGIGIWLGVTLTRKSPNVGLKEAPAPAGKEVPAAGTFAVDEARMKESDRFRIEQPGDCRPVVRQREHGEDPFKPVV